MDGKVKEIEAIVQAAIDENVDLNSVINEGLIGAMDIVGKKFGDGQIYVPEMVVSALAMQKALAVIKPLLRMEDSRSKGTVLMATVKGDLHDIGKNLVIMMLEGAGFDVIDLGVDLSADKLVDKVTEIKPDILGLSALLTTTMPEMQKVIAVIKQKGLGANMRTMVGGAPVDAKFADKIGADGYGRDAAEAVQLARKFMADKKRL
jgi:5-methyltetrahydrofolate--homocysteine methyltransferase